MTAPRWTPFVQDSTGDWVNSRFRVRFFPHDPAEIWRGAEGDWTHVMRIRKEHPDAKFTWKALQRVKAELVGVEEDAIELYPPQAEEDGLTSGTRRLLVWMPDNG